MGQLALLAEPWHTDEPCPPQTQLPPEPIGAIGASDPPPLLQLPCRCVAATLAPTRDWAHARGCATSHPCLSKHHRGDAR
eukprot:3069594-Amphidinium_carterae.1